MDPRERQVVLIELTEARARLAELGGRVRRGGVVIPAFVLVIALLLAMVLSTGGGLWALLVAVIGAYGVVSLRRTVARARSEERSLRADVDRLAARVDVP